MKSEEQIRAKLNGLEEALNSKTEHPDIPLDEEIEIDIKSQIAILKWVLKDE